MNYIHIATRPGIIEATIRPRAHNWGCWYWTWHFWIQRRFNFSLVRCIPNVWMHISRYYQNMLDCCGITSMRTRTTVVYKNSSISKFNRYPLRQRRGMSVDDCILISLCQQTLT